MRSAPGGAEVAQVDTGAKLIYLDEQEGWFQVELEDGTAGWVSSKYASKE